MQSTEYRVRTFSGFRAWVAIALALALGVAIIGAVAVVAIGILLFVLPVLILSAALSYAFLWFRRGRGPRRGGQQPVVLEGEYRVLDAPELERQTGRDTKSDSGVGS